MPIPKVKERLAIYVRFLWIRALDESTLFHDWSSILELCMSFPSDRHNNTHFRVNKDIQETSNPKRGEGSRE